MPDLRPSNEYALKLHRAGGRPEWRTRLSLAEALDAAHDCLAREERATEPAYLTATIYKDAMVVTLCRYFPPDLRVKKNTPSPDEDA